MVFFFFPPLTVLGQSSLFQFNILQFHCAASTDCQALNIVFKTSESCKYLVYLEVVWLDEGGEEVHFCFLKYSHQCFARGYAESVSSFHPVGALNRTSEAFEV